MRREFIVETPICKLRIWAKYDKDNAADFPGVYVDMIHPEGDICLACIEYDSNKVCLQTVVYGDIGSDIPTDVIKHTTGG